MVIGLLPILTYVLIMKVNEMHYSSNLFDKVLYMFRTCSTIRHQQYLNTVYTAIGDCICTVHVVRSLNC